MEQCKNATRNATKIKTMSNNQANEKKKNSKFKAHQTFSLFIRRVKREKN